MSKRKKSLRLPPFRPDVSLIISRDRGRSEEEIRAILDEPDGDSQNEHEEETPPENAT